LAGCDGYGRSQLLLYLEKKGLLPNEESPAMEVGNALEGAVIDLYAKRIGLVAASKKVADSTTWVAKNDTRRRVRSGIMFCTPDALLMAGGAIGANVQVKIVGVFMAKHWGKAGDEDGVPDYVQAQVQWEMHLLNVDTTHVVALIGTDLRVYNVRRNQSIGNALAQRAEVFWSGHVLPGIPPPPDGGDAGDILIRSTYPKKGEAKPVSLEDIPSSAAEIVLAAAKRAARAKQAADAADAVLRESKQIIDLAIGNASGIRLRGEGFGLSMRRQKNRGKIDWQSYAMSLGGSAEDAERFRSEPYESVVMSATTHSEKVKDREIEDFLAEIDSL